MEEKEEEEEEEEEEEDEIQCGTALTPPMCRWYWLNELHLIIMIKKYKQLNHLKIKMNIKRMTTFRALVYVKKLCVRAAAALSTELLTDPSNNGGFPP